MTSKHYLELLKKDLAARTLFENSSESQKLESMNLYRKAAEVQKPIIEAIKENKLSNSNSVTSPATNITTVKTNVPKVESITRTSVGKSYSLIKTGEMIESPALSMEFEEWKFKSKASSNIGNFILMNYNGEDRIWNFKSNNTGFPLTKGLEEILFSDAANATIISNDDIRDWQYLINSAGLASVYNNSKIAKKLLTSSLSSTSQNIAEVTDDIINVEGKGLSTKTETLILPSNSDELRGQLILQMQAMKSGHDEKSTFNHANAIMKELIKQKKRTSKEYRDILKHIYHV
jgi:hypothetical protein